MKKNLKKEKKLASFHKSAMLHTAIIKKTM
jgi:hypothetical protein